MSKLRSKRYVTCLQCFVEQTLLSMVLLYLLTARMESRFTTFLFANAMAFVASVQPWPRPEEFTLEAQTLMPSPHLAVLCPTHYISTSTTIFLLASCLITSKTRPRHGIADMASQVMATPHADTLRFPLLFLPPELRLQIYGHLSPDQDAIVYQRGAGVGIRTSEPETNACFLRVCESLYSEALPSYYASFIFRLNSIKVLHLLPKVELMRKMVFMFRHGDRNRMAASQRSLFAMFERFHECEKDTWIAVLILAESGLEGSFDKIVNTSKSAFQQPGLDVKRLEGGPGQSGSFESVTRKARTPILCKSYQLQCS
jgi:hypothetical protein